MAPYPGQLRARLWTEELVFDRRPPLAAGGQPRTKDECNIRSPANPLPPPLPCPPPWVGFGWEGAGGGQGRGALANDSGPPAVGPGAKRTSVAGVHCAGQTIPLPGRVSGAFDLYFMSNYWGNPSCRQARTALTVAGSPCRSATYSGSKGSISAQTARKAFSTVMVRARYSLNGAGNWRKIVL